MSKSPYAPGPVTTYYLSPEELEEARKNSKTPIYNKKRKRPTNWTWPKARQKDNE
ncbi:hypothetical protein [Gracilibacillus dipsosauri]|uniref:hypothetical protein n=1 Tax=Gracilibacillus dipsosauri TaxID=178340 RepID=UPI0024097601